MCEVICPNCNGNLGRYYDCECDNREFRSCNDCDLYVNCVVEDDEIMIDREVKRHILSVIVVSLEKLETIKRYMTDFSRVSDTTCFDKTICEVNGAINRLTSEMLEIIGNN